MPGGREICSEWSLIYQLSPGCILLCGHSELIMPGPGDHGVIRWVLMVPGQVCHWVMTIKSPRITSHHCWLVSPHWWLSSVQCWSAEPAAGSSPARPARPVSPLPWAPSLCWLPSPHSTLLTTHEPQPMKFSGLPTPAQQPATPATILDRTGCRERWVGRQLEQRKLASIVTKLQRFKHICFIILLKQSPFEFNLSNHRFPINFSLQESTTNNASETITYNLTRLLI